MKKLFLNLALVLLASTAHAAPAPYTIPNDRVSVGKTGSTNKIIEANLTKSGASTNPKQQFNVTTGKWEFSNDGTSFKSLGSGSGSINFIPLNSVWQTDVTDNVDAEGGVGNWAAFADAAATTPVDLTGGSPNVTIARTTTAGEVINGSGSFEVTKSAANRQGEGVSVAFNIPPAYQGKIVTIKFPFKMTGTVASGDIGVWIYDVTNSTLITPANNSILGSSGTFRADFLSTPSAGTPANQQYRIGIYFASTSTNAVSIYFDDVQVGPQESGNSAAIGEWQPYPNPVIPGGTLDVSTLEWRQNGTDIELRGTLSFSATSGSVFQLPLPGGRVIANSVSVATKMGTLQRPGATDQAFSLHGIAGNAYLSLGGPLIQASGNVIATLNTNQIPPSEVVHVEASVHVAGLATTVNTSQSVVVTTDTAWTPTVLGCDSVSGVNFRYAQVADRYKIDGSLTCVNPNGTAFSISLPGLATVAAGIPSGSYIGSGTRNNASGGAYSVMASPGGTTIGVGTTNGANGLTPAAGNAILANGDVLSIKAEVKIAGLGGFIPSPTVGFITGGNPNLQLRIEGFTSTASCVVTETGDSDWINGNGVDGGTGLCSWTINTGIFSAPPVCVCTGHVATVDCSLNDSAPTATSVGWQMTNGPGSTSDQPGGMICFGLK